MLVYIKEGMVNFDGLAYRELKSLYLPNRGRHIEAEQTDREEVECVRNFVLEIR